jgi:hypothetical protein
MRESDMMPMAFQRGQRVFARSTFGEISGTVQRVEGDKVYIVKDDGEMDVYRAGELRADSEGHAGAMTGNMRDIKQGIKGFFTGKESVEEEFNPTDSVSMDVPLMIRIMEYAREDAKTDMALHDVAENLIRLSNEGRTLTMADYDAIVGSVEQDRPVGEELGEEVDPALANKIRQLYQQIYNQGDDALEYLNTSAPLFAQFWDQYEGDLDSMIAELSPKNLIRIAQELKQVAGQEGVAEGHRDEDNPFSKGSMGDALWKSLKTKKASPEQQQRNRERFAKRDAEKAKQQGVAEVAPKGWEGTVKSMKKHKEIDNPWALTNYMKNKGYHSHKTKSGKDKRESVEPAPFIKRVAEGRKVTYSVYNTLGECVLDGLSREAAALKLQDLREGK